MLNEAEKGFFDYWEQNRLKKKKLWRQLSVGLPLAVALAAAMLVNIYSGWNLSSGYLKNNGTQMIVIIIAILLTVVFVVIFSARHKWDMNEQYYRELMAKKDKP